MTNNNSNSTTTSAASTGGGMGDIMKLGSVLGLGGSVIGGIVGFASAQNQRKEAERNQRRLAAKLKNLEDSRQDVTNPYEGYENLSDLATDLSGMISNPYANLGVATQAAEIQIEEADIALANTLDTLRSTGSGAGGATALAQAALQSKKGVAASIETQEAQNEKLRAQGESQMEQLQMREAQRIQGVEISEGQRMQTAEGAGNVFMFNATEQRETAAMDRVSNQLDAANAQYNQSSMDQTSALTGMFGGLSSVGGSMVEGALGIQAAAAGNEG